jgi:SAM-dependent methyltransferase
MTRQRSAWENEYRGEGTERIESSYTFRPEPSVLWYRGLLARRGARPGRILDVGCGRGRNALPFLQSGWSVTGLDVAPTALKDFRRQAAGYGRRLRLMQGDIGRPLPFADGFFDALLEITAADNLIAKRLRDRFWREAARVLKPGGRLLSYHFTPDDGYYGPLLLRSRRRRQSRLYDRRAGMHFRFYGPREIVTATRGMLAVEHVRHYHYAGPMFGKIYKRDLNAVVLLRGPNRMKNHAMPS